MTTLAIAICQSRGSILSHNLASVFHLNGSKEVAKRLAVFASDQEVTEVVGSKPAGCWAFTLLYLIGSASLIRSLVVVQNY